MYRYLHRLQENVMYCDTDSAIYIQPKGDGTPMMETGDKLGEMTCEFRHSKR